MRRTCDPLRGRARQYAENGERALTCWGPPDVVPRQKLHKSLWCHRERDGSSGSKLPVSAHVGRRMRCQQQRGKSSQTYDPCHLLISNVWWTIHVFSAIATPSRASMFHVHNASLSQNDQDGTILSLIEREYVILIATRLCTWVRPPDPVGALMPWVQCVLAQLGYYRRPLVSSGVV